MQKAETKNVQMKIAVDCGKFDTKVAVLSFGEEGESSYKRFKFRTKASDGTFIDDMLEKGTVIVEIDGKTYKVGPGATKAAEMETSKKSEIHKICTLTALAECMRSQEPTEIDVVIGIPYQICIIPEERIDYKNYILPDKEHTIKIMCNSKKDPTNVVFHIKKKLVYPESIGVLYMYPTISSELTGIVDIGNLNINNTYCDMFQPVQDKSFTEELGGEMLISGLAQTLSSELGSRVDTNLVAATLKKPLKDRFLVFKNKDEAISEKSKKIIDKYLEDYVRDIKEKLNVKKWPLDFMQLVFVGGTTSLVKNEIIKVFGENVFIPDDPEYANVEGFLKKMCADDKIDELSDLMLEYKGKLQKERSGEKLTQ